MNIPLKRLAVESGAAVYGRNNITYVDGLGSLYSSVIFLMYLVRMMPGWKFAWLIAARIAGPA